MKKILLPTDGSKSSVHAIQTAIDFGYLDGHELYLLSVVRPSMPMPAEATAYAKIPEIPTDYSERAAQALAAAKELIGPTRNIVQATSPEGDPAAKIIENAKELGIDLIIMGNRGLGAFSRTFLGSVSHKILNHADCSVLIIKE